jgi:anti-sigma B factor antagonist
LISNQRHRLLQAERSPINACITHATGDDQESRLAFDSSGLSTTLPNPYKCAFAIHPEDVLASPLRCLGGNMKVSTRKVGAVVVIDVEGKILFGEGDIEIKQMVDDLLKKGSKNILLNLAHVPYLDSAGLGEIIRCFTTLRKNGGNFKLLSPNRRIIDLLNITNLVNVFDWFDDEPSALASYN